jgi:Flp pilus assembly protein TadD
MEPSVDLNPFAESLVQLAKDELSLGAALGLGPEDQAKILELAIAQMNSGRSDQAARVIRRLIALDPHNPIFHEYLGLALERQKDFAGAVEAYGNNLTELARLKDVEDRLAEGHLLRGQVRALTGDLVGAKTDLSSARLHLAAHPRAELGEELSRLERILEGVAR